MFKMILVGPPGAGKGTQAKILSKTYRIPHISTGNIFRDHISRETPLGMRAKQFLAEGNLVPDDVTNGIVQDRLSRQDCKAGFLLDGYPRTVAQAEFLRSVSRINAVIEISVPDEEIVRRLSSRWMCKCGSVFNVVFNPPKKEGICDACGEKLYQRDDDDPKVIKHRLETYRENTLPLIQYYKEKGKFFTVDGTGEVDEIATRIRKKLTGHIAHVRG